jgi:hypothetical protein
MSDERRRSSALRRGDGVGHGDHAFVGPVTRAGARNGDDDDAPIIDPPGSATVDFQRRPVLYLPDGRALVRRMGF